jgi:phosphopantothenoylcysteine synthetase/decarboxylase
MEKTEKDIISKNLTQETLKRQKDIEVRLLQSIKAEKERGKENKREAEQGVNRRRQQNSTQLIKIDKKNKENILILKPLELDYYFNQLYEKYIYQINAVK